MDETVRLPQHIAIILDGNGRWAVKRGLPRTMGHKAGCDTLEQIMKDVTAMGIPYLTVYGFSTENWKRSEEEVNGLFTLFRLYLKRLLQMALENNVRIRVIGDTSRFASDFASMLRDVEEKTKRNTRLSVQLALNYGSRDELTRAVRSIAKRVENRELRPEEITEAMISSSLDTAGIPDPDLLIRTGSEMRLSNYLLWQCAYTELYVTDVLWPDFSKEELLKAIAEFNRRDRRYGGVKA